MSNLTDRQADEGWCCRGECCGPGSWCCSHANPDHACTGDDELPGMWEHADFLGGATDVLEDTETYYARREQERNDAFISLLFFFAVVPPAVCILALLLAR